MNDKQKKLLITVSAIIAAVLLFPPYVVEWRGNVRGSGFAFIFDLPNKATANVPMLFAEMAGILTIGVILYLVFRK